MANFIIKIRINDLLKNYSSTFDPFYQVMRRGWRRRVRSRMRSREWWRRVTAGRPDLTEDQKTFLLVQKSLNATYKDMVRRWPDRFTREPPFSFTVLRILKRARVLKRARENIILAGRNDFKAFIL